ncbi:MAG: DNA repair protein RadC [Desulfovibrio sp.]|nr:MAG: DNA repair protein RadC [Desulfovibrio sp.]
MSEQPHYHGHRERLRQRLLKDPGQLADYELLELILAQAIPRRDTKPLAKELLATFGTIRGVFMARADELQKIKGFGPGLATFWVLLKEFRARFSEAPVKERVVFSSPSIVAEVAMARLGENSTEEMWMALVDTKNRLISWERVAKGTVGQAPLYPREVLAAALKHEAAGIILVHNHPGGDPNPSRQDVELTERIARAAHDLGVRLLDHVIVCEDDYYSFQSEDRI